MDKLEKKYQEEYTKLRVGNFSERKEVAEKLRWLKLNKHKNFTPPDLMKEFNDTLSRCRDIYNEAMLFSGYTLPK